jgi:hypothetical protein
VVFALKNKTAQSALKLCRPSDFHAILPEGTTKSHGPRQPLLQGRLHHDRPDLHQGDGVTGLGAACSRSLWSFLSLSLSLSLLLSLQKLKLRTAKLFNNYLR